LKQSDGSIALEVKSKGRALARRVDTWTKSGNGRKLRDSVDRWTESKKIKERRSLPKDMR